MNENVKTKTPKWRRWVARLLVSALCILLASSLLFVGVAADVAVLSLTGTSFLPFSGSGTMVCILDSDFFATVYNDYLYLYRDDILLHEYYIPTFVTGYVVPSTDYHIFSLAFDRERSLLYLLSQYGTNMRIITLVVSDYSITSASFASYSVRSTEWYYPPAVAFNGHLYIMGYDTSLYHFFNGDFDLVKMVSGASSPLNGDDFLIRSSCSCYCDGLLFFPSSKCVVDLNGNYIASCPEFPIFVADGLASYSSNNFIYSFDSLNNSFFASYQFFNFSYSGQYLGFDSGTSLTLLVRGSSSPYQIGLFSFPSTSPPESSDETTETPPPESSGDTSGPIEVPEGYTKIWRTSFDNDGSYTSKVIDALDLREITSMRAFLGTFPSSESGIDSDDPIPLTIELYDDETLVDTVQYNFYAFGYSLSWMADYSFPDYVGDWIVIPLSDVTDIYFAENCPYGSVVLNSSLPVSEGGARISINLDSPDSYFTIRFLGNDLFSVYVYNDDPLGNGRQFDFGVKAYKKFSLGQYGNVITSPWYYPEESTSVTYTSSDVTEKGLFGIFFAGDSSYDTDINMSKLEDISRDHELLESLAESIYGQYSFDSLAVGGFDTAISASDKILDSSGGNYILNYMFGMWTVHPFASAMIAIVGSLAIIGFIIRKM